MTASKIAYILPSLQGPGGWRSHSLAFIGAISHYIDPILFVSSQDAAIARSLFPGYEIFQLPTTQMVSFQNARNLSKLIACFMKINLHNYPQVDLVHSLEAYPTGLIGSWLAAKVKSPHVITVHGTYGVVWHQYKIDRAIYSRVLSEAALVCPVSNGTSRIMREYFAQALSKTTIKPILNGNNYWASVPHEFAYNRTFSNRISYLTVGDLKPRKGQHISLAAFSIVKQQQPDAIYTLVGKISDQDYHQKLIDFIKERNIKDIHIMGAISQEELQHYYRNASLFVLTPQRVGLHFEGFGLVYLEAGAYGLPVVGTATGGVPDAIKDGETGIIVDAENIEGIAEAMLRLHSDEELALQMGRANRLWAETLTWERCALEQLDAYRGLTSPGFSMRIK